MDFDKFYIGVVGQIACGKGKLVECLVEKHGFVAFSLSIIVHEELKKRGITSFTRKTLQDIGDELRRSYGDDILARKALTYLKRSERIGKNKVVIEGIRNPAEIRYLKSLPNSVIIGVKSKRELRFKRLLQRRKPWDPKIWEEFLAVDRRDLGVGQKSGGQQVGKCLNYCDYVLTNNNDVWDFHRKVKKLMERIFKKISS